MRAASLLSRVVPFAFLASLLLMLGACSSTSTVGNVSITDRFNDVNVPASQLGSVTASCNAGEQMVGGGYAVTTTAYSNTLNLSYPLDLYPIAATYPSSATSWTATLLNRVSGSTLLFAHVECISKSVGVQIVSAAGTIESDSVTASCPQGTQRTSGGFQVLNINQTKDVVTILSSLPSGQNAWTVKARSARNSSAKSNGLKSYAVCAANTLTTSTGSNSTVTAPPGLPNIITPGPGHATCGTNQLLTGAGFRVGDTDGNLSVSLFFPTYDVSPAQWGITMVSLPDYSIEGQPLNGGGSGDIVPICANVA